MMTLRVCKPFAIGCLMTLMASQLVLAGDAPSGDIVQTGRRRNRTPEVASNVPHRAAPPRQTGTDDTPTSPSAENAAQQQIDPLLQLAERAIDKTSLRYLDADQHTPWQIMHGMVALRRNFELTRGDGKINCVEFISEAPKFRGEEWWQVTKHGGRAHPFSVPYAFEGHANQFLALLSMSNLPLTHKFNVDGTHTVTMADMINNAKMTVNAREEITWTLWFLTHYTDIDSEWTNEAGEPWSLEKLVQMQTKAPVTNAPCGGCHGLFAIAYARNAHLQKHGRLHGIYHQADQKIQQHIELARSMQNRDGSFAVEFFKGPGHSRDFNERIKASGHMLEWLMMALPQDRLQEPWLRRAVASISTDLIHNASQPAECGPLYHALNSLIMYRDRVKPVTTPAPEQPQLAKTPTTVPEPKDPQPVSTTPVLRAPEPTTASLMPPTLAAKPDAEPKPQEDQQVAVAKPAMPAETAAPKPTPTASVATETESVSRANLMAMKAARRLAAAAQQRATAIAADEQGTSSEATSKRMAIEPSDRIVR